MEAGPKSRRDLSVVSDVDSDKRKVNANRRNALPRTSDGDYHPDAYAIVFANLTPTHLSELQTLGFQSSDLDLFLVGGEEDAS